jgi:hypothetical protein
VALVVPPPQAVAALTTPAPTDGITSWLFRLDTFRSDRPVMFLAVHCSALVQLFLCVDAR